MKRRLPPLVIGALVLCAISLWSLLLSPKPHRALTLERLAHAPLESLASVAGGPGPVWDDSPARLGARTKVSGCIINGPHPDPACTPGAVFATTTVAEICVTGYTKTVRSVSTKLKQRVYSQYGIPYPQPTGSYEADHFIPLGLGGNNDIANLFPEAGEPRPGFKEKDLVENYLRQQVCEGKLPLPRAQEMISRDWVAVYDSIPERERARLRALYTSWADRN